jgi:curli production assembly/transport component CsgF
MSQGLFTFAWLYSWQFTFFRRVPLIKAMLAIVLACVFSFTPVHASELIYTPINPAFGGSPSNKDFLLSTAEAQNKPRKRDEKRNDPFNRDPLTEFSSTLQTRLLSSLSDKITQSIYGPNAGNDGVFTVDNTTVAYQRVGSVIKLTLSDGIRTTSISLPAY